MERQLIRLFWAIVITTLILPLSSARADESEYDKAINRAVEMIREAEEVRTYALADVMWKSVKPKKAADKVYNGTLNVCTVFVLINNYWTNVGYMVGFDCERISVEFLPNNIHGS